ncbi:YceI family protein [Paenibacillus chartarius]|uniref:YceI family protein n=1 Tax=Paenibacillus chartarius TaxID=747481 RepID=A0ABV6DFU7_9BACL
MKKALITGATAVVVLVGGGYWAFDYFAGNHVEVKQVISSDAAAQPAMAAGASNAAAAPKMDGTWNIQTGSEVYFSVTTSKETVNFKIDAVKGSWEYNAADPAKMKAEAAVDLSKLNSGNAQRDNHIKGKDYMQVDQFPEAKFTVTSFEQLPKEWQEGVKVPFTMKGKLEVKGMSKDVTFESEALLEQGQIKMQGKSKVTFADFGMKNPHTVVLDTQNDVTLQLSLILKQ